jgi:signal transduction histidine kinase
MPSLPPHQSGAGQPDPPPFRDLSQAFWRGISSTTSLGASLAGVLAEFNRYLGSKRAGVWLHDRRARELWLVASSDGPANPPTARVPVGDPDHPAARGLRLEHASMLPASSGSVLVAPLRGWRRALGTLVIEGPGEGTREPRAQLDAAADLGRQLSTGIENVQLLEEMLLQRRLLEDTFNSLTDLVVVTDGANRVVQMNDAVARRLGRPRGTLHEQPLAEVVGADLADWATAPDGEPAAERVRTVDHRGLGGRFVVTVTPLINEDRESVGQVLVARDVTRQTRLESEQEALRAKLAQAEKLASLGQFVAGIAHEINNPLQGVLGHLELLLVARTPADSRSASSRALRRELRRIYREADRAAKIVQNLLTFSGSLRIDRRRLRIERVLQRVVTSERAALARAHIDLVREERDEGATVTGDALLLQQAFLNVLINAEHAIAGTGRPGSIFVSTTSANRRVVTTIRDTGPGIPAEVLPRIFDPFFTTKAVGQGTGLGLAITYGIVQEHDGHIHVENHPAGGTIVTIELPAADPVTPARRTGTIRG